MEKTTKQNDEPQAQVLTYSVKYRCLTWMVADVKATSEKEMRQKVANWDACFSWGDIAHENDPENDGKRTAMAIASKASQNPLIDLHITDISKPCAGNGLNPSCWLTVDASLQAPYDSPFCYNCEKNLRGDA